MASAEQHASEIFKLIIRLLLGLACSVKLLNICKKIEASAALDDALAAATSPQVCPCQNCFVCRHAVQQVGLLSKSLLECNCNNVHRIAFVSCEFFLRC